jgi:hypothetical protein
VIIGFGSHVFGDFRVRQDEKALGLEPFHRFVGHLLRLERAVDEEGSSTRCGPTQHVGAHALRAERRHGLQQVTVASRDTSATIGAPPISAAT